MLVVDRTVYQRLRTHLSALYGQDELPRMLSRIHLLAGRYGVGTCPDEPCGRVRWDQRDAVLITYGDMVRGEGEPPLRSLLRFLENHLSDTLSAVHVLPFFPSSSDDGFAVIDYRQVDPALGDWEDIEALGADDRFRLMVDLVINHVSSQSNWFRNFANGIAPERHYFIEVEPDTDLSTVTRPRTSPLLRPVQTPSGERLVWATFSHDQIDVDFSNPDVLFEYLDILLFYVRNGARIIRLDAVAYLWKTVGTNCIHLEQTHLVVKILRDVLDLLAPGIILLTETNVPHQENIGYFGAGDEAHMVYQFSLPPLLLHALETGESRYLMEWVTGLEPPPPGCTFFNFTASHDGIGLRPLEGLLPDAGFDALVERMQQKGGQVSWRENPDGSRTPYELNITYFDALSAPGRKDSDVGIARFLCSQTIMLSLQGIPGIYFNSLVAAPNWLAGVEETGRARTINRRKWGLAELEDLLGDAVQPASRVLAEYRRLLGIRRAQAAFHPDGPQRALQLPAGLFGIERTAPDGSERIWVLANLTAEPLEVQPQQIEHDFEQRQWSELIQGWSGAGAELGPLQLAPYQVMWLRG
ncbi:sugar phosphorylase [Candidatus Thiosymbion oneisti]|uniref:sugar phosphorylase n=1 Tax=Candidatus Thiosymbion oneisti TaxID=589554 RepID=UPI000A491428|nr:sugar phosphorylase [Candidatus Thiosymbion oneisti]